MPFFSDSGSRHLALRASTWSRNELFNAHPPACDGVEWQLFVAPRCSHPAYGPAGHPVRVCRQWRCQTYLQGLRPLMKVVSRLPILVAVIDDKQVNHSSASRPWASPSPRASSASIKISGLRASAFLNSPLTFENASFIRVETRRVGR